MAGTVQRGPALRCFQHSFVTWSAARSTAGAYVSMMNDTTRTQFSALQSVATTPEAKGWVGHRSTRQTSGRLPAATNSR